MMDPYPFSWKIAFVGLLWWGTICMGLGGVGAVLLSLLA